MTKTRLIPIILTLCAAVAFDASARYKGDLNGDNRVDLADMVYLAKAIQSGSTDKALDVNASGSVDDYDLQRLADIIISGKLTEDTGMNVGIGGWEETDEDFGGTVKAPAFTTRSAEETRFYMHSPRSEGDGRYSMEFGISEGNEAPAAILFNIRLPREMQFDGSEIVVLDSSIASSHKLYGTPKFVKENEDDEWSEYSLRFIILSPDLSALPNGTGTLGRISYSMDDCSGSPVFVNCQTVSGDNVECTEIPEHDGGYNGDFKPIEVTSVWFDQSEMLLIEGDESSLYANIDPSDATDTDLVWSSSDENVVTVSSEDGRNAVVKAVNAGETVIKAVSSNGLYAECTVVVEKLVIEVQSIQMSQENLSMIEGNTVVLTATIDPVDATDKTINWSSSDESIATVSTDGAEATVSALAPGNVEIFASSSNGLTATCFINVEAKVIDVTEILLDKSSLEMTEGDIAILTATVNPSDATDKTLTWTSSDTSIVTVSENGDVTAVAPGSALITVSSVNGISASCEVTVVARVIEVIEVVLDKSNLEMTEGDTAILTASVNPSDATDKTLTWTSSDTSIVTVSENGDVTAVAPGSALITVSSANGISASCEVTVVARVIEVAEVVLDKSSLEMTEGDTTILTATVNPSDATDKTLTWTSSDASVVSVSADGEVKALKAGTATITVSSANGKTATCVVTVAKKIIEVTGITLSNTELKMTEGDVSTLTASVQPADATDKALTWTSSNEAVATVSANGEVKAVKEGNAVITVKAANGVTATCKVTVESGIIVVTSVTLDKTSLEMTEGEAAVLKATVNPADATDKTLTWTSSDSSVATVSANGEVKAIKAGSATITVSSANGKNATCVVSVAKKIIEVTGITLSNTELKMTEGDVATLTASVQPADATDKALTWTSSNEAIATVSANGEVKAVKEGNAVITVKASNGVCATCKVTVESGIIVVTSVTLDKTSLEMTEGEAAVLKATVNPADATDKTLTWTSSDSSVATVSATGEVKALKAGTTNITVSSANGKTATCKVTVAARIIEVVSVSLDKTSLDMTEGDTATLTVTVNPSDATDRTLTWTSSDASVASVSAIGEVKALKAGTATITVSTANGKTATCIVTVEPKVIEMQSINLDAEELALEVGDTHQFIATVLPAETTYPELEWWTDDETVATVDQNGLLTMVGEGTTTVHVRSVRWPDIEAVCRLNVTSGVEGIMEEDAPCDIYTTNGKLLKQSVPTSEIRKLDRGLYIIRQRGKTTKLLK